jgi:hypothetical protein
MRDECRSGNRTTVRDRLLRVVTSVERTEKPKQFKRKWFLLDDLLPDSEPLSYEEWDSKRNDHSSKQLASISPLLSLLQESGGNQNACVDKTFKSLFYPADALFLKLHKFKISIFTAGQSFKYSYLLRDGTKVSFMISNPILLRYIVILYYGCRCVLVHGSAKRTLLKGALSHFPAQDELCKLISGSVCLDPIDRPQAEHNIDGPNELAARELSNELYNIYDTLQDKSNTGINYLTLVNMIRFFRALSLSLTYATAYLVWRDFNVRLWEFDPNIFQDHNPDAWLQLNIKL